MHQNLIFTENHICRVFPWTVTIILLLWNTPGWWRCHLGHSARCSSHQAQISAVALVCKSQYHFPREKKPRDLSGDRTHNLTSLVWCSTNWAIKPLESRWWGGRYTRASSWCPLNSYGTPLGDDAVTSGTRIRSDRHNPFESFPISLVDSWQLLQWALVFCAISCEFASLQCWHCRQLANCILCCQQVLNVPCEYSISIKQSLVEVLAHWKPDFFSPQWVYIFQSESKNSLSCSSGRDSGWSFWFVDWLLAGWCSSTAQRH